MAEILLDALTLEASAVASADVVRIGPGAFVASSQSTVLGKAQRLVRSSADVVGSGTITDADGRLVKHVRTEIVSAAGVNVASAYRYKTVNSSIVGESTLEAFTYHRDIHRNMHDYLPPMYSELVDVQTMIDAEASEVIRLQAKLNEVLDQFYVNSASYGLDRWEKEVGIETIPQRSTESRQHYINAKLRGHGVVTKDSMKSVVDAFYYSEVTEKPRDYTVSVKLLGKRGIPKNLEDIDVAVTDIIPAHLANEYEFTYATWGEIGDVGLTWQEADEKTLKEFEETFYVDPGFPYEN